ncbi:unnamed protein product, partial [Rotaria sp. Silwood1]
SGIGAKDSRQAKRDCYLHILWQQRKARGMGKGMVED